ncbi:hypothetical protein [Stakelama pacifica]|uniref:Uncharacterized protein n=1 Tax=Stakelama pacifica TaxID=517720 RepID=A0A4R6FN07_9SPHN|nr:hypothetical protein [Stakelama pacifica]TDN82991.1 hypothetical protein EV664_105189 [Stakelama pacifica]GGO94987.1 hypothetical protein GCM10011329_18110 [Stakelama pacifica]
MRNKHERHFYHPANALCVRDKHSSAVAYIWNDSRGRPHAVAFQGKAQKPAWNFYFANDAAREKRVRGFFAAIQRHEAERAKKRAERSAWQNPYKVGQIFSTCWGYDQTNREYYEVVEVRGKHLIVREIATEYVETQWLAGKVVPLPGSYISEPHRVLAQPYGFREPRYKHHLATLETPTMVGGVPTYGADFVSSYH